MKTSTDTVIVTRHPAMLSLIRERFPDLENNIPVIEHVSHSDQVRGKTVFGTLPLALACLAREIIEIPLNVPQELRGVELTLSQLKEFAGEAQTYVVLNEGEVCQVREFASGTAHLPSKFDTPTLLDVLIHLSKHSNAQLKQD